MLSISVCFIKDGLELGAARGDLDVKLIATGRVGVEVLLNKVIVGLG